MAYGGVGLADLCVVERGYGVVGMDCNPHRTYRRNHHLYVLEYGCLYALPLRLEASAQVGGIHAFGGGVDCNRVFVYPHRGVVIPVAGVG